MQFRTSNTIGKAIHLFSSEGARQGYLAAVDQGIISLANFLATIILARSVTPTELGMYGVGFTLLRLVRSIQEGITIQPLNTIGASLDEGAFKKFATSTSIIQFFLALFSSAGVAITGWVMIRTGNDTAGPTLFYLWQPFLWWQLQEYLRRMLYARGKVLQAVINSAIANAIRLGFMLYWLNQDRLTGIGGLSAISLGALCASIPGIVQTRYYWSKDFDNILLTWKRNWNFGRYVTAGTLANWVSVEFYPVLTAGMISFAAAGAYRALQNLVAPIHLLIRATDAFLTPRAARAFHLQGQPGLQRILRITYRLTGLPTFGLLLLGMIFRQPILAALYGDRYLPFANGVILFALFYALWFAYWPLQAGFKACMISRPIFLANLAALILMFTLGIGMIKAWGVYGTIGGQALNAFVITLILGFAWKTHQSSR